MSYEVGTHIPFTHSQALKQLAGLYRIGARVTFIKVQAEASAAQQIQVC